MNYSVHQPQYLPWIGFFDKVAASDVFVYLDEVQYKQREFQNRNKLRTKDGWMWLTVPVAVERDTLIKDVAIDASRDWRPEHAKSLKAWYGRAPFFEKHAAFFHEVYARPWERLLALNVEIIRYLLDALNIKTRIVFESELAAGGTKTQRIINIGKKLGAETYLSGSGGRDYLDEKLFKDADIKLSYQEYKHPMYRQQFMESGDAFLPYMSTVDLLFNVGDKSLEVLRGGGTYV
jgi:hypothetical protein